MTENIEKKTNGVAVPIAAQQPEPAKLKRIEFTQAERELIEEGWAEYTRTIGVIARLHGIRPNQLGQLRVTEDRSALLMME